MIAALIIQSRAISSLSPVGDCVIGACAVLSRWTEASEAASRTSQLQQLAAGGAGEGLRDHPLPGHLHEGSPGGQTGPDRGQSAGTLHTEPPLEMFTSYCFDWHLIFWTECKLIYLTLWTLLLLHHHQLTWQTLLKSTELFINLILFRGQFLTMP